MANLKTPITQNDHVRGPAPAPITLVEYGDYQCPHCAMAHPMVNQVERYFSGRMRFVFRHFPFWDMHDALFENQSRLSIPTIFLIAEELGLPETAMRNALETGQFRKRVRDDFMSGIRSGVNGTPTFFINGVRHDGAYDYASLVSGIQMRLAADTSV
jgi:protein-disulfide isomerase